MISITAEINQSHAGKRFKNLRNRRNLFSIASFTKIWHAFNNFHCSHLMNFDRRQFNASKLSPQNGAGIYTYLIRHN